MKTKRTKKPTIEQRLEQLEKEVSQLRLKEAGNDFIESIKKHIETPKPTEYLPPYSPYSCPHCGRRNPSYPPIFYTTTDGTK